MFLTAHRGQVRTIPSRIPRMMLHVKARNHKQSIFNHRIPQRTAIRVRKRASANPNRKSPVRKRNLQNPLFRFRMERSHKTTMSFAHLRSPLQKATIICIKMPRSEHADFHLWTAPKPQTPIAIDRRKFNTIHEIPREAITEISSFVQGSKRPFILILKVNILTLELALNR